MAGPGSRLAAIVRAHVGVITDDVERASVFVSEWRSLSAERRNEIARRRDTYERRNYLTLSVARSSRLTTSLSFRSEVNQ